MELLADRDPEDSEVLGASRESPVKDKALPMAAPVRMT